ncbi:proteinase-activated receptor 4-like [Rhinophrynus dorsalis]
MATWILYTVIIFLTFSTVSSAGCLNGKITDIPNQKGRVTRLRQDKCNASILDLDIQENLEHPISTIMVPSVYSFVLLLGLPANGIAFWVLTFKTKKVPSSLLLLNLAAADLLFLLALPLKIAYHFLGNKWIFGEIVCRIVTAVFYGNMYCSVFFLMAISIDRYIALVHPFSAKCLRGWRSSIIISVGIWLVVAVGVSIFLVVPQTRRFETPSITTCHEIWATCKGYDWYTKYFIGLFAVGFAIPLVVIVSCYVRILIVLVKSRGSHRHVIQLILLVLVTFILFFTPSNILLLLHYLESEWECHNQLYIWYTVALSLTSFNCCIDPFVYYYMSQDFRTMVKEAFCGGKDGHESSQCTKKSKLTTSSDNKGLTRTEG